MASLPQQVYSGYEDVSAYDGVLDSEPENRVGESKENPCKLKPGFPSKTPLKGTIISAKCEYKLRPDKQDFCVPPHVICFKHGNQFDPEVAIVTAGPPRRDYHKQIAGISVSGILSPKNAMDFEESDGRFALVFAGQARLLGRKTHEPDKSTSNFKMLDEVWVDGMDNESEEGDERSLSCHMKYNDDTMYLSPFFYDKKVHQYCLKIGIVVGVSEGTDLFTVELIPCERENEPEFVHEYSGNENQEESILNEVSGSSSASYLSKKQSADTAADPALLQKRFSRFNGKSIKEIQALVDPKGEVPATEEAVEALLSQYEKLIFSQGETK